MHAYQWWSTIHLLVEEVTIGSLRRPVSYQGGQAGAGFHFNVLIFGGRRCLRTDNCKVRCHIQQSAPARPPRDASCFTDGSIDFRKVELANRKVFGVRADDVGGRGCAKGRRW